VNYGGGNGAGCFEVKVRADTAKFTNVIVADDRPTADASATFSTCSVYLYRMMLVPTTYVRVLPTFLYLFCMLASATSCQEQELCKQTFDISLILS